MIYRAFGLVVIYAMLHRHALSARFQVPALPKTFLLFEVERCSPKAREGVSVVLSAVVMAMAIIDLAVGVPLTRASAISHSKSFAFHVLMTRRSRWVILASLIESE
jgi:hypothetical protein